MGPVISQASLQRIHGLIQGGVDAGAELALDGRGVSVSGYEHGSRLQPAALVHSAAVVVNHAACDAPVTDCMASS